MLDAALKTQLASYLERVTKPIQLVAFLDESAASREMLALLEDVASLSPSISLLKQGRAQHTPSFAVGTAGEDARIRFAGTPLGHEFNSFVLALLHVGGHPVKQAEALLAERGFTLGHYPQSFEYATIGGFAATRSAGQSSSGYGRFDSLVSSIRLITPEGELSTLSTPHTSIGPALREVVVGSEGILGVIPDVDVRIRPLPAARRYEAWIVEDFEAGCEIVRGLAQADRLPTIIRVSDDSETEVNLAMALPSGAAGSLFRRYLKLRGREGGALVITGYEGSPAAVHRSRSDVAREIRRGGGVYLGQAAGKGWEKGRFHGPYLREALLERGVLVETLETAQQWSGHRNLYETVRAALKSELAANGMEGIVMCHLSHAYRDGASLYFTVISTQGPDGGAANWPKVKRAACAAIQSAGGTLSHHHATGRDHAPWIEGEIGTSGIEALAALKERFDPSGIMNPGKLLDASRAGSDPPSR